jgi:F-type H+-transporting ATPase subunit b
MNVRRISLVVLFSLALVSWLSIGATCFAQGEEHATAAAAEHGGGGHGEEHGAGNPNPLAFDPDLALFTLGVFILLFILLAKFAWPAISAALDEREQGIRNNITDALAKHEEAKQMLVQYEAKLASAANEVRALLDEARRDAEATKNQILVEAKAAADAERDRALRDVERAAEAAMKNIAETIANQAVDLAGKVVSRNLTGDQHTQLVRDAMNVLTADASKN